MKKYKRFFMEMNPGQKVNLKAKIIKDIINSLGWNIIEVYNGGLLFRTSDDVMINYDGSVYFRDNHYLKYNGFNRSSFWKGIYNQGKKFLNELNSRGISIDSLDKSLLDDPIFDSLE